MEKKLIYIDAAARGIPFDERFDSPQAESVRNLRAEIERLRKLCEDRPVYPPLSDKRDPYSAAFDAWLDRIDAAGRGEGK
jgi:hypothetical protein